MKLLRPTFALLAAVIFAAASPAADEKDKPVAKPPVVLFDDPVAARGKGFEIKSSQVEAEFIAFKANMAAQNGSVPEDRRGEFEAKILDRLVVTQVLLSRATTADRTNATEKVIKFIKEAKERETSEESFNRRIRALGLTPESFHAKMLERGLAEEVFSREVKSKAVVPPERVRKLYDENPQRFESPEMVRASHILILTRDPATRQELTAEQKLKKKQVAAEILSKAKQGGNFEELAKTYSEDTNSKKQGGAIEPFPRGRYRDAPEMEAVAFALGLNQLSEIVQTQYGYHIVKVTEKIAAKKVAFAEVEARLKDELAQQDAEKEMPAYLEKIKKEAEVEILVGKPKP